MVLRNSWVGLLCCLLLAARPSTVTAAQAAPSEPGTSVEAIADVPAAESPSAGSHAHALRPPGVDWFEGEVSDAFAEARTSGRQVFLYWGAVWCPPCQELKATIFKRRDFLDRLKLFVPVYLDGDAAGAQAWGERFRISGYPTVLVLRADQTELERVSGGMDLARYAEVLDLALGQGRPVQELLAAIGSPAGDSHSEQSSADDCRRLAYNAWMLDEDWTQHPESLGKLAAQLGRAAQRCPKAQAAERARLQVTAIHAFLVAEAKELRGGMAPSAPLHALLESVPALLADRALALSIGDALWYLPADFFAAAASEFSVRGGQGRATLQERWFSVMDTLSQDARYSSADRLDAVRSKVLAAKALSADGKVPAPLAAAVTRRIDEALAREHEPYARASLVNSALNVLDVLDDAQRAHDILAGEIRTSAYAYYYMADLGELEERRGHTDLAIEWLARSYQAAQGPATRFQWGVGYVSGLVRMRPQDDTAIRDATLAILSDLDAAGDLHGRTLRSLRRLEVRLRDWGKDASHAAAIGAMRRRMHAICDRIPAADSAQPACAQFLDVT